MAPLLIPNNPYSHSPDPQILPHTTHNNREMPHLPPSPYLDHFNHNILVLVAYELVLSILFALMEHVILAGLSWKRFCSGTGILGWKWPESEMGLQYVGRKKKRIRWRRVALTAICLWGVLGVFYS